MNKRDADIIEVVISELELAQERLNTLSFQSQEHELLHDLIIDLNQRLEDYLVGVK